MVGVSVNQLTFQVTSYLRPSLITPGLSVQNSPLGNFHLFTRLKSQEHENMRILEFIPPKTPASLPNAQVLNKYVLTE